MIPSRRTLDLWLDLGDALAVAAQALTNNKYVGFMVMIAFFVAQSVLPLLDLEHGLYRYAADPSSPYSDMNGYGHFGRAVFWYRLYWGLGAHGLLVAAGLLWPRGTDARFKLRARTARSRIRGATAATIALATGNRSHEASSTPYS